MKKNILRILLLMLMVILFQNIIGIKEVKAVFGKVYKTKDYNPEETIEKMECKVNQEVTFYIDADYKLSIMQCDVKLEGGIEVTNIEQVRGSYARDDMSGVNMIKCKVKGLYPGKAKVSFDWVESGYKTTVMTINVQNPESTLPKNFNQVMQKLGYRLTSGTTGSYDIGGVAKARTWMLKQGIVSDEKINSKKIKFDKVNFKDEEIKDYDGLSQAFVKFNNIPFKDITLKKENGKTVCISNYSRMKNIVAEVYVWDDEYTMEKGNNYWWTYEFVYCEANMGLYYKLKISNIRNSTAEEDKKSTEELKEATKDTVTEYEKAKKTMEVYLAKGQPRSTVEFTDVLDNTDYYTNVGDIDSSDADKVEEKVGTILSVITNIGMLLSVIMPAILGIKYMLGSVEEKADYKRDMIPYLVGAVLLFGVCTVVKILQAIGNSINNI